MIGFIMEKKELILKIIFVDPGTKLELQIIGVVEEEQLVSPINGFILVKNYFNKTISKDNIVDIIPFEEYQTDYYRWWQESRFSEQQVEIEG